MPGPREAASFLSASFNRETLLAVTRREKSPGETYNSLTVSACPGFCVGIESKCNNL